MIFFLSQLNATFFDEYTVDAGATLFVKPWRISRHRLCSLPEGVKLYTVSYVSHGER